MRVRTFSGIDDRRRRRRSCRTHVPTGQTTDLGRRDRRDSIEDRPQGQAVVLLSDGIQNAGNGADGARRRRGVAKAMAAPVYTPHLRRRGERDSIWPSTLRSPQDLAFVGQRVPVTSA